MRDLFINGYRGDIIETRHRVHAVVLQGDKIIFQCGNIQLVSPMRSAAKPFMVSPQINLSSKCGIHLSDSQISLMVSSHNGEQYHRTTVKDILELSGSTVKNLHCGTHLPFFSWLYNEFFMEQDLQNRQLFHNCSGKHAGMLLLATLIEETKDDYWMISHPVQQMITSSVEDLLNISKNDVFALALDGCGVPTYCVTLRKMAEAYQRLYKDERLFPVFKAVVKEPEMIAGKDRVETDIIRQCGYFAKSGSDGIFCVAIPDEDISIALKIEDGNDDAAESAVVELLCVLNLISPDAEKKLEKYRKLQNYTSTGVYAGYLSPEWSCVE